MHKPSELVVSNDKRRTAVDSVEETWYLTVIDRNGLCHNMRSQIYGKVLYVGASSIEAATNLKQGAPAASGLLPASSVMPPCSSSHSPPLLSD